ncbi:hypothetical protein LV28_10685 [Pandoraea pnomenusa]|uniref:Protein of uncharacterized function DUF262 n=1 Tax=Pandoraea pnomenusa TaxID=93220 RepID=A0A378YMA7_9BURK|nr:DUF262 domain-containing protein [Pandoraea pnomenusa]AIU26936.1 hypothetical protein LV28_10685 [Pandoraea pnomenusa]SUA77700.1 Protein of uncharacterised function DUF262 [Pandoraea pnomenusa]
MNYIETHPLQHSTIQSIYSDWDLIVKDPSYQRNGDVWSKEKKQLLIDSVINRYDIPKIYFHRFDRDQARKTGKQYAVIDGRQRLETIVKFMEDEFSLSDDFRYLEDPSVIAAGMNYSELAKRYPRIKSRFDSFSLPIITVETDDLELIDDMFSRLNEAVPLNAAEKRRAIGGDLVKAVDEISKNAFFAKKVRFSDARYQWKESAVRLLFLAHHLRSEKVVDTKKPFLDAFALKYKAGESKYVKSLKEEVKSLLDAIFPVFVDKDSLLQSQASVPVYVFVFQRMRARGLEDKFSRSKLEEFNRLRMKNRVQAEDDISSANFELLEYDRLSQQGTNDANSLRERWRILEGWLAEA